MYPFDTPNFFVMLDNLSSYLIGFHLLSFSVFILTLIYWTKYQKENRDCDKGDTNERDQVTYEESNETESLANEDILNEGVDDTTEVSLSNFKVRRHKEIMEKITSTLSENELEQEKEVERMQLEKIFELLKTQEDKFHVSSVEQVQDQLALYRL